MAPVSNEVQGSVAVFFSVNLSRYKTCAKEGGDNINYPDLPSSRDPYVKECELAVSCIPGSVTFSIYDQNSSKEYCYFTPTKKNPMYLCNYTQTRTERIERSYTRSRYYQGEG